MRLTIVAGRGVNARKRTAAVAAVAAAVLALAGCGLEDGPAGRIVEKDRDYYATSKTWTYALTVRKSDGSEHKFRVSRSDYDDCYRGSAYPKCSDR